MGFPFWRKSKNASSDGEKKVVYYLEESKVGYSFGKNGLYHFYRDCKGISTPVKEITSDSVINYRLCDACSKSHTKRNKRALKKFVKEFPQSIQKLNDAIFASQDIPEEEKEDVFNFSVLSLQMQGSMLELSASMGEKPHSKHVRIERIRKSILYAEKGINSSISNNLREIDENMRKENLSQINKGISGARYNCGGNGNMEVEVEYIGNALEAMVLLDYWHTKLNRNGDGKVKDFEMSFDFSQIRDALGELASSEMCSINQEYKDLVIRRRVP